MIFDPLGSGQRPFIFQSLHESGIDVPHLQADRRRIPPTVVDALQVIVEEPLLNVIAVVRVKVCPVLQAVDLEPLLPGGGLRVRLDIAAKVESVPTPVACR